MRIRKKSKPHLGLFFISFILSISLISVQKGNIAFAVPAAVILDPDSVSTAVAGNSEVTGLTSGEQYIITTDEETKYVQSDGTLSDESADIGDLSGTKITGLTNGKTYLVQKYEDTFADWQIYSHTGNWNESPFPNGDQNPAGGKYNNHIILKNNGDRVTFYGYGSPAYKDFMYLPNNTPSKKTFAFELDQAGINYHSMEGGGFLFNTKVENGLLSGYSLLFTQQGIKLFEINNINANAFHEETSKTMNGYPGITLLSTFQPQSGTLHSIKIEASPSKVNMWDGETQVISDYALPTKHGNGIGLIASYAFHGCSILSYFTYTKLQIEGLNVRWPIMDLVAKPLDEAAKLTFTAPNNASSVTLQYSTNGTDYSDYSPQTPLTTTSTSVSVTGLTNGQKYYFRLSVVGGNNAGYSNVATATPAPATKPDAPTDAVLVKGVGGRSMIKLTPPVNDGGSPITKYIVTINPGNISISAKGSTVILTGLKSNVNYTFTVKAVNSVGDSIDVNVDK